MYFVTIANMVIGCRITTRLCVTVRLFYIKKTSIQKIILTILYLMVGKNYWRVKKRENI